MRAVDPSPCLSNHSGISVQPGWVLFPSRAGHETGVVGGEKNVWPDSGGWLACPRLR